MGNGQDLYSLGCDRVDDRVREVPHDQTPLALTPLRPEQWVLKKQHQGVLKVAEESLCNRDTGAFPIVFGCLPKIGSRVGCSQ